ncbi:ATP-dependent RNA helicase RhlE [Natronocella acetinitrilica]|uniref:ATP-dependent RNA helicase RhlE n=1 Tax=Natronocella acetinitrilica TaxID=414046 RepID=A0AAE3G543_9GAMM|nr:DEAD/DEAH box helicase [Natronocella acetinitrilica]MCP1675224.1 ATP-dependent RNA helicase RhlE [Natronocella acetinitrilica]
MSFTDLGLSADLVRTVAQQGYDSPTPIQTKAIPCVLSGQDLMAAAQTGTGKTAAFTLPLLQRLASSPIKTAPRSVRCLILTPTRELAAQVQDSVRQYSQGLSIGSAVVFGGVGMQPQVQNLRRGVDILVATPGRLLDHVRQGTVDLSRVEILVLDEADRMLDMGFIHDIRKVLAELPKQRQTLLFSATFSDDIRRLADGLLHKPQRVEVAARNSAADAIEQVVHPVDRVRKRELLSRLIHDNAWRQVLVFTRTKHGANRLATQLDSDGLPAAALHGNKSQTARTRALADFKQGRVRVLVATDIAARGLDIDQLPHVVNFELPTVAEDYVHRIGRTGRAGHDGEAVSLVCIDEQKLLRGIELVLRRQLPQLVVSGFEPDPTIRAEPLFNKPQGGRRGRPGGGSGTKAPNRQPGSSRSAGRREYRGA